MADDSITKRIIRRRAFRHLAEARISRLPYRIALYGAASLLAASFVPLAIGSICVGLFAAAAAAEIWLAKAYLAQTDDDPALNRAETTFATANLASTFAAAGLLAMIWVYAGETHLLIPLCVMATGVLNAAVANQQVVSLLVARQIVYIGTGVAIVFYEIASSGNGWSAESVLKVLPVCLFAAFALQMSLRSARAFRDQLMHEMQLARAKETTEKADAAKTAFMATVSHELRTPLNGMLGIAQMLAGSELTT